MFKRVKGFFKEMTSATLIKVQMLIIVLTCSVCPMMAQNTAGDYTAGTNALSTVAEEIAKYVPICSPGTSIVFRYRCVTQKET